MGIVKMPRTHWENSTQFSNIADVMSQNSFETLLRYFHFTNNHEVSDEKKKSGKLWKLDPWLCALRENCLKVWAEEFQSIDEIIIAFKRISSLCQYMPAKPHKWGFKIWGRSGISGFLHGFKIYEGKIPNTKV